MKLSNDETPEVRVQAVRRQAARPPEIEASRLPGRSRSAARLAVPAVLAAALLPLACNSGANQQGGSVSGNAPGDVVDHTEARFGSLHFVVDPNSGGSSSHPRILDLSWGRLANIYDSTGTLQQKDMVIGHDIPQSDPLNLTLTQNPVTGETVVTITQFAYGTPGYFEVFHRLDANLTPIQDKSLDPNELPPYSLAPRNSALVIQFDDLIDETTLKATTLKVLTGNPPIFPFDARLIPDVNYGDTADFTHPDPVTGEPVPGADGVQEFHSTRIIVDTTVSEIEAAQADPPLPVNALGFPQSPTISLPNVALRIPTQVNPQAGQLTVLENLSGRPISFTQSGSNDAGSVTFDIVRAFRSGNNSDANHGFLFDDIKPRIVGSHPVFLGTVVPDPLTEEFHAPVTFNFIACANRLKAGDVIQQPGVFGQVTEASDDPAGGTVADVTFRIVFPPDGSLSAGPAQVSSVFDSVENFGQQACFIRFPIVASPPASQVATDSSVIIRFSEPIDPATVKPFDSFFLTRISGTPTPSDFVIGQVTPASDLRQFTFVPVLPYNHAVGTPTNYWVNMAGGTSGPTDLAGNALEAVLPQINFTIDPAEQTENNGGFALRFNTSDEINPGTPNGPELRGQFLFDVTSGLLRPRTVSRFAAAATRDKPVPSIMPIPPSGVQTPLSPLGSKLHMIWRYCDVGFGLQDESFYNVDVEGLDWAPVGGSVVPDAFDRFEIILSHCLKLPDESINPNTLLPLYDNSGLRSLFSSNVLDPVNDPQKIVHPRARGYIVDPADRFQSNTTPSVIMMPYPLNRNLPVSQHTFYTWRDTSLQSFGGPVENRGTPGAELAIVVQVLNLGDPNLIGSPYQQGSVPSVALPLLMEFKCFPDQSALGLNSFDINIAINSSSIPNFRAFSTGGTNSSGVPVIRDPDLEATAQGGFNPNSTPPGNSTIPVDNAFYIGQMDLITRISRAHSIWFNTTSATPVFSNPVVEPRPSDQPAGTQVQLAYRGATNASGGITTSALSLDVYGDVPVNQPGNGSVTFLGNDKTWKSSISAINGARFFQTRITFVSNADTLLTPTLSSLGFAFRL